MPNIYLLVDSTLSSAQTKIFGSNQSVKVVLIFNLGISKFCTRFPKLIVVPVYEMRFGIVRYDHLTSFETLAHTFPMFLPSQLSA